MQVLPHLYNSDSLRVRKSQDVDFWRHFLVRGLLVFPAVLAALPLAIVSGDVTLFPAWFLCISFLVAVGLAALWLIIGYVKVIFSF